MRYFLALASVIMLAGCASTFRPWNLSRIEDGMDRSQVVEILGEPDFTVMQDGAEHLHYIYREDAHPPLSDGMPYESSLEQEMDAKRIQRSLKQYEYDVILMDDKVVNYKEVLD